MDIGVLKETKEHEARVALTPAQVRILRKNGHWVFVEKAAGAKSGFADKDYRKAGAVLLSTASALIKKSHLVLKVKEPTLREIACMRPGQMIFSYLHLAAVPQTLRAILKQEIVALAYETVQFEDGSLPLLTPMSEIAGKLATQNGAHFLRRDQGGRGVLMGGTVKAPPAVVVILGAGVVGTNSARIAVGMGAKTYLLDISRAKLRKAGKIVGKKCRLKISNPSLIARLVPRADLVVGAVLVVGAAAPRLVSERLVKKMKKGSVIVDVAVDQGGCVETSEVTSHAHPIVVKHGVLHYGVPNIPAVVPVTSTLALTRATFPYILKLANLGLAVCLRRHLEMRLALNCAYGEIVHPALQLISK